MCRLAMGSRMIESSGPRRIRPRSGSGLSTTASRFSGLNISAIARSVTASKIRR
jgi:hypothetical protein